jgi:CubicO group peptidase (beta-lactamase class C family)
MQLIQEGKVKLDDPIDRHLKRWHLQPSSFDNNVVTIRRLLSHTSGISNHDYHGWDPASPLPPLEDSLSGKTGSAVVQVIAKPGEAFHYSGANYEILPLLIEDVSGLAFSQYMQSRVFLPLHMTRTQYGLPKNFQSVMAKPYDSLEKPIPVLRYNELAAAGLTTNIHDLAILQLRGSAQSGECHRAEAC